MAPRAREVRLPQIYQSKASFSLTISLPLSEKVKVLDLIRKGKTSAEIAKIFGKKGFSICELVKKEKEIHASF
jgi:hypothetical protein